MSGWGGGGGMEGWRMVGLVPCLHRHYEMQAGLLIIWAKILFLKGAEN